MKLIYIGLIFVIIIIIIILKNKHDLHELFTNNITIAVVGNGKLKSNDNKKINKCDLICRFNDTKNYNFIDKTDILFVRQGGITGKIYGLKNYKTNIKCKEIVFIGTWKEHYDNIKKNNNIPTHMIPIYEDHCKKKFNINKCILNNYNNNLVFDKKKYKIPYTSCNLSSGTIAIHYLLNRFPNASLEIFGMNWQFHHKGHSSSFEKKLITDCKRCNINKMNTNVY